MSEEPRSSRQLVLLVVIVGSLAALAAVILAYWSARYPLRDPLAFLLSTFAGLVGIAMAMSLRFLRVRTRYVVVSTLVSVCALAASIVLSLSYSVASGVVVASRSELDGVCSKAVGIDEFYFASEGRIEAGQLSVLAPAARLPDGSCLVYLKNGLGSLDYPGLVIDEKDPGSNTGAVGGAFVTEIAPGVSLYTVPYGALNP